MKTASIITLVLLGISQVSAGPPQAKGPELQVKATEQGFVPASITVRANVPAKISFIRQTDKTCATELLIPEYNIKRELPLNKPVVVEITPKKAGEITFMCGMKMFRGKVIVQDK